MSCADGSLSCGAISTTSSAYYTEDDLGLNTIASWAPANNNLQPTTQEKKAVVFNDGEVVLPPQRIGCCAAFPPQCSPCDIGENESYKADELLMTVVDKEEAPDDEGRFASGDSSGALGLMERDESGRNGMNTKAKFATTTTPKKMNKKVVSSAASQSTTTTPSSPKDASSPRTVISSKVFDSAPFKQPQQQLLAAATDKPEPITLEGYSIGDEAKLSDFAFNLTKEEATLQAKSLKVGDAAFILRSDRKWTYSIVIDKAVASHPDDHSALRFEVGADNMRKTFMEGQWGKYIRVITKMSDDEEIEDEEEIARLPGSVDKDNAAATAAVTKDDDATAISGDPDIQVYDSDSDDSDEEDYKRDTKPSSLRKTSKLIDRSRSQGSTGSRVHFKLDEAKSIKTDTTLNRKQRSGVKAVSLDNYFLKKTKVVEKKRNEEGNTEGFSVHFDPFDLGDDGTWTSDKQNEDEKKMESVAADSAPAATESDNGIFAGFEDNEFPAASKDDNVPSDMEKTKQVETGDTDVQMDEKEPFQCDDSSIESDNDSSAPIRPKPNGSWNVGQLFFQCAQPFLPLSPPNPVQSVTQEKSLASSPLDDVDESLNIECELSSTVGVKVHEPDNHLTSKSPKSVRMSPIPRTIVVMEDTLQLANDISMSKQNALGIDSKKGGIRESFIGMSNVIREKELKNKLVATVARQRSTTKSTDEADALNITADTVDSYEVHPHEVFPRILVL